MHTRSGWWLVVVGLVACGGRVEDPPVDPDGEAGAASEESGEGNGSAQGGSSGPTCAGTQPHPDYTLCYETQYPPCLITSSPKLRDKFPSHTGAISRGPWVGASSSCHMLCCYAP